MNFAQAMAEMFNGKIVCCKSIDEMSVRYEDAHGQEIIGYVLLSHNNKPVRITIHTCGRRYGEYKLSPWMSFTQDDISDSEWYVVNVKEKSSEILRRHQLEEEDAEST